MLVEALHFFIYSSAGEQPATVNIYFLDAVLDLLVLSQSGIPETL